MKKRAVALGLIVILVIMLATLVETYRSSWAVDSSQTTIRSNNAAGGSVNWGPVWVATLKTSVPDSSTVLYRLC